MSATTAASTPPNPTHEAFLEQWLPLVLTTVATAPGFGPAQARETTLILINALRPRDPTQAAIAGLCIATLFSGMEALRQSQEPGLPPLLGARLRSGGLSAVRLVLSLLARLQKGQGEAPTSFLPGLPELTAMAGPAPVGRMNPMHRGDAVAKAPSARPAAHAPAPASRPEKPASPPPAAPSQNVPHPAPRQFDPMPSEHTTPATAPGAAFASAPAAAGTEPSAPMSRKDRKAAKYALRRAMRTAHPAPRQQP